MGLLRSYELPKEVKAGAGFWLEIKAEWTKSPEQPLPLRLFTDLSLTAVVDLAILPDSVVIQSAKEVRERLKLYESGQAFVEE